MSKYNGVIRQITDNYDDNFFSDQPYAGKPDRDRYALFLEQEHQINTMLDFIQHDTKTKFLTDSWAIPSERISDASACNGAGIKGCIIRFQTTNIEAVKAAVAHAISEAGTDGAA